MAYVQAALERSGYPVVCCESGVDALRLLENGSFLGVVSDMRTPGGVDGGQVHAWLARHRPDLASRIIFITGDIANEETVATLQRNRRPLRGETFPRAAVYRCGREDFWEGRVNNAGSKEDLRIRLLIVDDEQSIRKLCVTVGEALGFVCLEAESGESALALLEEQSVAYGADRHGHAAHVGAGIPGESKEAAAAHRNCAHDRTRVD